MSSEIMIKVGSIYRHYREKDYRVMGIARHSETHEDMVVYQALYHSDEFGSNAVWVRPLTLFLEQVEVQGELVPRFRLIDQSL